MIHYKFRAEGINDVWVAMAAIPGPIRSVYILQHSPMIPDVTVEFEALAKIDTIKKAMLNLDDLHVIIETLMPISQYDGFRRPCVQELKARVLWEKLGEIPVNDDGEIEEEFNPDGYRSSFEIGTDREVIWHWFEEVLDVSVHDLMYKK